MKTPGRPQAAVQPGSLRLQPADEYAAIKSQLESSGLFKVDLQSTEWTQFNKDRVVTEDSEGSTRSTSSAGSRTTPTRTTICPSFFRDANFVNNGYSNKEINDLIVKQAGEKDESVRENLLEGDSGERNRRPVHHPAAAGCQTAVTGTSVKGVVLDASFRFRYASITK